MSSPAVLYLLLVNAAILPSQQTIFISSISNGQLRHGGKPYFFRIENFTYIIVQRPNISFHIPQDVNIYLKKFFGSGWSCTCINSMYKAVNIRKNTWFFISEFQLRTLTFAADFKVTFNYKLYAKCRQD